MIIETENSFIISAPLYGYIIVFRSSNLNCLGLMKVYIEALSKILQEKFSSFSKLISDKQEEKLLDL